MSGYITEKFWHLKRYSYPYYRFVLNQECQPQFKHNPCLTLDAGCGSHISSLHQVPKGVTVIGVDVSHRNILSSHQKAKQKAYTNFSFVVANICFLPFKDGTFNLAVCIDVLEHIAKKRQAIHEISRTCKRGGELVGSTSNLLNPIMLFDSLTPQAVTKPIITKIMGEQYERHSRFTPSKLAQTLNRANFKAVSMQLLGFPPFRPALYEFSNRKLPWYAYLWVAFNKLTDTKPLNLLKATVVFCATKR